MQLLFMCCLPILFWWELKGPHEQRKLSRTDQQDRRTKADKLASLRDRHTAAATFLHVDREP